MEQMYYRNRELSWLDFDKRVLEEAMDLSNPFCERLTFASIFKNNLDEFFMVRVGMLHDSMMFSGNPKENKTDMTAEEQIEAILRRTKTLTRECDETFAELLKEVVVLVELQARFDEENNIEWSRRLEEAGCTVIYGLDGYKVHSKLCLITKKSDEAIEYYTQIGTGNYNEKTSRLYTDLSLMTADMQIGAEASRVFHALAMGETVTETQQLLVAPNCLQDRVLALIDGEISHAAAGEPAYIGLKMNSLTDKTIIDKLIEASQAGVQIDMVIRGICCLIPGIPGYTENIRVRSIVGRFLEHSRIYIFGTEERACVYIASADFMTRNTLRRVEVGVPVHDQKIRNRLLEMFQVLLEDNCKAREEQSDGTYASVPCTGKQLNAQEFFYQQAYDRAVRE